MDIRFCDLCQESVPEADLHNGRAKTISGRLICPQCDAAMGGRPPAAAAGNGAAATTAAATAAAATAAAGAAAGTATRPSDAEVAASMRPAPPAPPASTGGAGRGTRLLALGAAAAVGLGAPLLLDRIEALEGRFARSEVDQERGWRENRSERGAALRSLTAAIEAIDQRSRESQATVRADLEAQLARLEEAVDGVEASSTSRGDRLRAAVDAAGAAVTQLREEMARSRERDAEITELRRLLGFHGDQLVDLEERLRSATVVAEAVAQGAAAGPAAPSVGSNGGPIPEWTRHVEDLASPDPGLRLDAVFALGQSKDLAVASHVVPMLGDEDVFVRMVSAQVLGALKAKIAVPALIEVLPDDSSAVREAAVVSLRAITGESFGFDPAGRTQDRGRALESWRAWWRRSGDEFLTS